MSAKERNDGAARGAPTDGAPQTSPRRTAGQVVKDIALFFAAPFITLAYMPMFAIIGIRMLLNADSAAWHEWHASEKRER